MKSWDLHKDNLECGPCVHRDRAGASEIQAEICWGPTIVAAAPAFVGSVVGHSVDGIDESLISPTRSLRIRGHRGLPIPVPVRHEPRSLHPGTPHHVADERSDNPRRQLLVGPGRILAQTIVDTLVPTPPSWVLLATLDAHRLIERAVFEPFTEPQ